MSASRIARRSSNSCSGRLKTLTERRDLMVAHVGFLAQARDQRLLAALSVVQIVDVALRGGNLGAQPAKLSVVSAGALGS